MEVFISVNKLASMTGTAGNVAVVATIVVVLAMPVMLTARALSVYSWLGVRLVITSVMLEKSNAEAPEDELLVSNEPVDISKAVPAVLLLVDISTVREVLNISKLVIPGELAP